MLFSPLEQFQIFPIIFVNLFCFDFSITNLFLISLIAVFFFLFFVNLISTSYFTNSKMLTTLFFVPSNWQNLFEQIFSMILQLIFDNVNKKGEPYFPFIIVLFLFILVLNLIGLVSYSFTITSHIIITFIFSISIFIGLNIICLKIYKSRALSLFIPANTSFSLALLLVPIEFISYFFKPISLGVRLFANLMAGHTLLKVIVGFSWDLLFLDSKLLSLLHLIPLFTLVILFGLELAVAAIQAYVFTILTCIYLNESINLH